MLRFILADMFTSLHQVFPCLPAARCRVLEDFRSHPIVLSGHHTPLTSLTPRAKSWKIKFWKTESTNEVRILILGGKMWQNVIFRRMMCVCVCVCVCGWSCLKLITVGFGGYYMHQLI